MSIDEYKVTIAVPIYGVESYVETCAISLFEQTYSNLEYLFIDDLFFMLMRMIILRRMQYLHWCQSNWLQMQIWW